MAKVKEISEDEIRRRFAQMNQAWEILIECARRRECISYTDLSNQMFGRPTPRSRAMRLGQILTFCRNNKLPELSVIVVTKRFNRPAENAPYEANLVVSKQKEVFQKNWDIVIRPKESDFRSY